MHQLMGRGQARPSFHPELAVELRKRLEEDLADVARGLGGRQLVVHKSALARVHACERHWAAEEEAGFAWSPATAMGAVTHKALELSVHMDGFGVPALVDVAMERLAEDPHRGPGSWLLGASELERAELRSGAMDRAVKFEDEFPPLKREWRPRLESPLIAPLCDDRIVVRGKVDLALGRAEGNRAGVLIVDFKTGQLSRSHADDLRFYALLETLRSGVPPFRVATWYLDSGHWHQEDVDEAILHSAARRVTDGARKLFELQVQGRAPHLQPGPACDYCTARYSCEGAAQQSRSGSGDQEIHSLR
jgi:hypothetical protein